MAEDPTDRASADFVTVAEAARLLELSERHVRRLAGRLPDTRRTEAGHGTLKVSLSALSVIAGKDAPTPDMGRTSAGHTPDAETGDAGHTPDILREMIERQDREIAFLRSSLEKSQALQLAALGEAAAMRGRVEALETQNRALLESAKPSEGSTSKPDGLTVAPDASGAQNRSVEAPAGGIVARLKRLFGGGDR